MTPRQSALADFGFTQADIRRIPLSRFRSDDGSVVVHDPDPEFVRGVGEHHPRPELSDHDTWECRSSAALDDARLVCRLAVSAPGVPIPLKVLRENLRGYSRAQAKIWRVRCLERRHLHRSHVRWMAELVRPL
jgi:hypothetical protein